MRPWLTCTECKHRVEGLTSHETPGSHESSNPLRSRMHRKQAGSRVSRVTRTRGLTSHEALSGLTSHKTLRTYKDFALQGQMKAKILVKYCFCLFPSLHKKFQDISGFFISFHYFSFFSGDCKEALGLEPVGLSGGAARCFAPGRVLWAWTGALRQEQCFGPASSPR